MFIYLLTCRLNSVSQNTYGEGIEGKRGRNVQAKKWNFLTNKLGKLIFIDSLR